MRILIICLLLLLPGQTVEPGLPLDYTTPALEINEDPPIHPFLTIQESPYDRIVMETAMNYELSPFLLLALLFVESKLEEKAKSKKTSAVGIAQFTDSGRHAIGRIRGQPFTREDALSAEKAIPAAGQFLDYLREVCGDIDRALVAYNTGKCNGRSSGFVYQIKERMKHYVYTGNSN